MPRDNLWGDGWTPPDRERNRQLYAQGRALRGTIQDSALSRRTANDLVLQMRGMLIGDELIRRNELRDVWIVPARLYAWLQARGHDLRSFDVSNVADADARAQAKRYADEFRAMLGAGAYPAEIAKPVKKVESKPAEPSPWDVRRIEID